VAVDGDLYLVRPGEADLVVRDPDQADIALVRRLAEGPATPGALASILSLDEPAVCAKLRSLLDAGVLLTRVAAHSDELPGEDAERFSRQLPYLSEIGDEFALQRRIRAATVAVIGCGGIGTWAIAALASLGVGRLILVDDDTVELSNLNRQVLYRHRDLGAAKAGAAAAWVSAFDPAIEVSVHVCRITRESDAVRVIGGADAVVHAADWPPYEITRWINAGCLAARTPFITAGQVPPILRIGPTYMPGAGPCFTCHEHALRAASPAYDDYVASRRSAPSTASTLGPASGVIGALIGLELMQLLTQGQCVTQDQALLLDMRTLELRRERLRRDPACRACQHLA
jgi:molybdopterin-synthase adenylyltransferase